MLEPFLACDSAMWGAVFDRSELSFIAGEASDLGPIVVVLRCREGRGVVGFSLVAVFLRCVSFMYGSLHD